MAPTANEATVFLSPAAEALERMLAELRPKLHRYCARMVGSVIEAEDVVQEALVKAVEASRQGAAPDHAEAWLFRIAHNAAMDHLRQRARLQKLSSDEDMAMIADPVDDVYRRQVVAAGLRTFMLLPPTQRSSVILMDVLGYSLAEIGAIIGSSIPAVKAALHRGRERLREVVAQPDEARPPALSKDDHARLAAYVDRFNARDFDAVRDMLADDVRLDLVSRSRMVGRAEVGRYFGNYAKLHDWRLQVGFVDRRPALIVSDLRDASRAPVNFITLDWTDGRVSAIRDFYHARYALEGAEILALG
jgi:RNA polymerase sigma-70 factor (ECF subfamily)